ncbi:MAG: transketolase [Myxococcota bacterium]
MPENVDQLAIQTIRGLSMDAVQAANSGHPGTPMALAPLGWLIYSKLLRHDPLVPDWAGRDRFVLSCGHASMLQYSLLHLSGYDVSLDEIRAFRQWGSKTPGHPEVFHTPGVETTTGPLGQGISNAVGMAMAARYLRRRFSEELFDHRVWVIASDGDLMEGVASEAASLAGHLGLGQLIVFWDDNEITIDGRTDLSFTEDVVARFAAYGWHTESVDDGNDLAALEKAALAAKSDPRPSFIRVKTIIGYPAPNKQDTSGAHGSPLGADEIAATKKIMGWPAEPFHVPAEIGGARDAILARGKEARAAWEAKRTEWAASDQARAQDLEAALAGELPSGWDEGLPEFATDAKGLATRASSGKVLDALGERIPTLVGGSADLTGSNKTKISTVDFRNGVEGVPRYVFWGVREHGMGSALNGMALHGGVVPFGATFLVFADYMRPAIRMAALMGLQTRYVFTHDSIGLGEDGPTHQPIETLASLRAIPGLAVFRPADANETREAWIAALRWKGPSALVLTRQSVPTVDRTTHGDVGGVHRGAYVLRDVDDPKAIVMATGSEVSIAVTAADQLAEKGVPARVVSVPCWELFEAQSEAYRSQVFPASVRARVVIEAGVRQGWQQWANGFVTLERFGASAPYETLYRELGLTAENVVAEVERLLG